MIIRGQATRAARRWDETAYALQDSTSLLFYVGGSEFFGKNTLASDFDYYALRSPELDQFLGSIGFTGKLDDRYPNSVAVFKHPTGVDVIALPQPRLEAVLFLQETLIGPSAEKLYKLPLDTRKKVTPLLYEAAINAMLKFRLKESQP